MRILAYEFRSGINVETNFQFLALLGFLLKQIRTKQARNKNQIQLIAQLINLKNFTLREYKSGGCIDEVENQ